MCTCEGGSAALGGPFGKRAGRRAYWASRASWRTRCTAATRPKNTSAGVKSARPECWWSSLCQPKNGSSQPRAWSCLTPHWHRGNLHDERVEIDDRIDLIERAALPGDDVVHHGIGDAADEVGRDLDSVQLVQVVLNVADAHAAGVERQDAVIEARQTPRSLPDQLRLVASRSRGTSMLTGPSSVAVSFDEPRSR